MDYTVKTEVFEGPLELLLHLIEKRKLFISDISLAAVTDDYIEQINKEGVLTLPDAAQFVYVASTLLLIKSRSLLPALTLTEEEAGDIKNLELRLKLYQRFKELAGVVEEQFGQRILYRRSSVPEDTAVFAPGKNLSRESMVFSIQNVLAQLPKLEKLPEAVVQTVVSLEEMIDRLSTRITKTLSLSFKEFSGVSGKDRGERVHVIVSFLALLELVKRGMIGVRQDAHFDDIIIESDTVGVPRYN